jgi:hypothetical protein
LLFLMDGSLVMESLDSLWFFTNVFSPRKQPLLGSASDEIATDNHVKDSPKEELAQPNSPILQNQLNELPTAENLVPIMCPKCDEIEAQTVEPAEMELVEFQRSAQMQERRRTRRRSKRSLNQRRKNILGELDVKDFSGSWMFVETCQHQSIMPSFNDNVAMKLHLKSWAYAVAGTVR